MDTKSAKFPIYLRNKDDAELKKFASENEVRGYVEDVDVENREYEGWDNSGCRVTLELDQTRALIVKTHAVPLARDQALQAFAAFAAAEGTEFTRPDTEADLRTIFDKLMSAITNARRSKPRWQRIFSRT
jgi:hypothetical protein